MLFACCGCGPPPFMIVAFFGWLAFVGVGVLSLLLSAFHPDLARPLGIGSLVVTVPIAVLGFFLMNFAAPSFVESMVLLFSAAPGAIGLSVARHRGAGKLRDPNRCTECDYELGGLREPRCPECGTPFAPHLLRPPPKP